MLIFVRNAKTNEMKNLNDMNTYYLEVLWADGTKEEIRIKAASYDVATNLHMWRRGYVKGMDYEILEINEH